jgi:hypothetical protein
VNRDKVSATLGAPAAAKRQAEHKRFLDLRTDAFAGARNPFHRAVITRSQIRALFVNCRYDHFIQVSEKSPEGGTNAIPEYFALLARRSCVARSHHGGCENLTYVVRPDAQRKNRATANYESARSNDDLGANGHGVRRVSRQLHRSADVALIDIKKTAKPH